MVALHLLYSKPFPFLHRPFGQVPTSVTNYFSFQRFHQKPGNLDTTMTLGKLCPNFRKSLEGRGKANRKTVET